VGEQRQMNTGRLLRLGRSLALPKGTLRALTTDH
jgi:hypothetical protein